MRFFTPWLTLAPRESPIGPRKASGRGAAAPPAGSYVGSLGPDVGAKPLPGLRGRARLAAEKSVPWALDLPHHPPRVFVRVEIDGVAVREAQRRQLES